MGVCQHTQDVRVCPSAHTERLWLSVCVRVCPSAHKGCSWLSISTHISTLVLGLSTLTLPVDCSGDFGPRELYVQYTQDVCGCPSAHTGRLWLSVCVRVCPYVSVSTHRTSVAVHQYTYQHAGPWTQHAGPSRGLFGKHMTSVCVRQHTQDVSGCPCVSVSTHMTSVAVRVCPSAHTGRSCLSVCVRVCPSAHTGRPCLSVCVRVCSCVSVSTHISTLTLPVDCSGDFAPCGLSVQYTQDVCGCPSAHTGRPWVSASTHRTSVAVRVCPSPHTGRRWLSICTHISMLVHGFSTLAHPLDCLGDFGQRGLSVQYTQDIRGCPPAHTGRLWLSVAVRQHTRHPWLSISTNISMLVLGLSTLTLPVDCLGDFGPRGLSVQFTQDVRGCPSAHTGRLWLSVCVRQHTQDICGCPSVHISARWYLDSARWPFPWTVWVILAHVGCLFSTHRTCVGVRQHTQDVRVCPSAHTGRPWLSVCDRVCPSAHTGRPWLSISTHISTLVLGLSTLTHPVDCSGDFGPCGLIVQYTQDHTQDVRGCPCVFVCVRQHTQDVTLTVPVDCSGDFGPCGLIVQYTQDVRGSPLAHTGRLWLSVSTHRTSVAVHVCPCVSVSTHRTSVAVHQYTYRHAVHTGRLWLSASTHKTSLAVRQHTQDVRGCLCVSVFVRQHTQDVRGCPSVHISAPHTARPWLSVITHRTSVGVRVCLWVSASTHRTAVAVSGCPSAHIGRPVVSVSTHRTSVCVRVCPCVSVSPHLTSVAVHNTHRTSVGVRQHTQDVCGYAWLSVSPHKTSVAVHQYKYQHVGLWTQHADTSRGLFGTSVAVRVWPWVSVSTHRTSVAVHKYTYQHAGPWTQHAGPSRELFG
ncbi:hypothetical protein YC2023_066335 [Brassica napus]